MKAIRMTFLMIVLSLFGAGCGNNKPVETTFEIKSDSMALTWLLRDAYAWHETESPQEDFAVMGEESDTTYTGMDWEAFDANINALRNSGYFHPEFIDNYKSVAKQIDDDLKSGKTVWRVGDVSPFGNGINPWCNCQDYPDKYWDKLTLVDPEIVTGAASFAWTWGGDFKYRAEAKKENNIWKISYLEGLDFNEYMQ